MNRKLFFASILIFRLNGFDGTENLNQGLIKFEEKRFEEASELLNAAYNDSPDNFHQSVASLYQTKSLLEEGKVKEAEEKILTIRSAELKRYPALFNEWKFTLGALAFKKKEWEEAAKWLEEALPKKNLDAAEWAKKTKLLLLATYKNLSNDPRLPLEKQTEWKNKEKQLETLQIKDLEIADPIELVDFIKAKSAYENKNFLDAKTKFLKLYDSSPASPFADASLYWAARSEEELPDGNPRELYTTLYTSYPSSPFAPDAYFYSYTLADYLQEGKTAQKHLQKFPALYPDHPLTLKALYLLGLDSTRDRKTPEGRSIARKNLTLAIDMFQEVETRFDKLKAFDPASAKEWEYLKNKAMLERAKANYEIALSSQGAKRRIYFEYAEEIFRKLSNNESAEDSWKIEALYGQGLAEMKLGNTIPAKKTFEKILSYYESQKMNEGYFLAEAYAQLAEISLESKEPAAQTLRLSDLALSAGKNSLSTDEKLALMIQKSEALKQEKAFDQAMNLLSDVVNFEAISSLRLKAMYLRAVVYEEQERRLLARKQLESLALKSGPWAEKARKKLEEQYGFN